MRLKVHMIINAKAVKSGVKYDCLQGDLQLHPDTYFSSLATEVNSLATATSNASESP